MPRKGLEFYNQSPRLQTAEDLAEAGSTGREHAYSGD